MRRFVYDAWNSVMDAKHNPLKHIPDMQVRHLVLQGLAWMWCATFSVMIGDFMIFGTSVIAHAVLIIAIVITVATFETAKRKPQSFNFVSKYHSYGRGRRYVIHRDKKGNITKQELPANDPGGEHE